MNEKETLETLDTLVNHLNTTAAKSGVAEMLTAVLVMDLGYTEEPAYGHTPLRHQCAWVMCKTLLGDEMAAVVADCQEQNEREKLS